MIGDLGSESSLRDWDGRDFWRLIFLKKDQRVPFIVYHG